MRDLQAKSTQLFSEAERISGDFVSGSGHTENCNSVPREWGGWTYSLHLLLPQDIAGLGSRANGWWLLPTEVLQDKHLPARSHLPWAALG